MNLTFTGLNLEVTAALREYVSTKLARINRHAENILSTTVNFSTVEKGQHKVDVSVHVAGRNFYADAVEDDMYAAIDILMDKLDRMLVKHKEINTDHRANASGRETVALQQAAQQQAAQQVE